MIINKLGWFNTKADAALIARAPELLEENERLRERIAELEAKMEDK